MREEQKNKGVSDTASLKRRSSLAIMCSLIGLVKPLLHIMLAAILLGTLGLCAIFLTILAGQVVIRGIADRMIGNGMNIPGAFMENSWLAGVPVKRILAMMGSFGPVVALSSLSNNLNQTLASGERVLSLLEEKPLVEEIPWECNDRVYGGDAADSRKRETEGYGFSGAEADHVTFAYENETIQDDYSLKLEPGKITGIHGASGSGKSTLLKLLMRFWDVNAGNVSVDGSNVKEIPTRRLRDMESYVTQETHLFHDSIANNIAIAKPGATREEIMEAAKKTSIHEFIMTLPKGYDTEVGELGDTLSGGEKQRIGIARAFLHDSPLLLLDEPTSNLDSLNEGIILKSLKENNANRTVVLVSHRTSTMNVADVVYEMENGRVS